MSYDLQVYGRDIDPWELADVLGSTDLAVEEGEDGSMTVVRGKRQRYSFTVGPPVRVEPEDVPEEVIAFVLAPTHMIEVSVEGSAASEIPHAIRAARRLATAIDGAALDQQTSEVFHRGRSRLAPRAEQGLVSVVRVNWYLRAQHPSPERVARAFVAAAKRHLPEAIPRRYGSYEPLQERWDEGGEDAFVDFVAADTHPVFMRGTHPVQGASIFGARDTRALVSACTLMMFAAPLTDERWQRALEGFFVEFAQTVDAVYASAEILRGLVWSGRSLWYGLDAEHSTYLAGAGQWHGLPPYPVWLSWFGREYAPLLRGHLTSDTTEVGDGLLHRRSGQPADRDALLAALDVAEPSSARGLRSWFSRRHPKTPAETPSWLPREYLAIPVDRGPHGVAPPEPAPHIPAALTK